MWGVSFRNHHQMFINSNQSFYYGKGQEKIKNLGEPLPDSFIQEELDIIDFNDLDVSFGIKANQMKQLILINIFFFKSL